MFGGAWPLAAVAGRAGAKILTGKLVNNIITVLIVTLLSVREIK